MTEFLSPPRSIEQVAARPFLRIAEHELDDRTSEWRGWFVECRRPDGTVVAAHPGKGLHGSQRIAFKAVVRHLREGGCPVDGGDAPWGR